MEALTSEQGRPHRRSSGHWLVLAFAGAAPLVLLGIALLLSPDASGIGTHRQLGFPECAGMRYFRVPCPGCGVTTSVTLMGHGRFVEAFLNQPLGVLVALLMALALPWAALAHARGRDLGEDFERFARGRLKWGLLAFAAAAWVYKIWIVRS